jgi:hypothetical protein
MKKTALSFLFTIALIHSVSSQDPGVGRLSIKAHFLGSVGFHNQDIIFESGRKGYSSINYSAGGGIGPEICLQYVIHRQLAIDVGAFYQALFMKSLYESSLNSNTSNESSVSFNKQGLNGALKYRIPFGNTKHNIQVGLGGRMIIPGKLTIVENNEEIGSVSYYEKIGYFGQLDAEIFLGKKKRFALNPQFRYNRVIFEPESFSNGSLINLEPGLKKFNGNGLDILLGVKLEL